MSEEIKEKLDLFPDNMNDIAKEAYYQLENYITSLQQKVEQLENENFNIRENIHLERISLPPELTKDKDFMELYDIPSYEDLQQKVEQLEKENKILKENAEHNDKVVDKVNWENMLLKGKLKDLKERIMLKQLRLVNEETYNILHSDLNKLLEVLDEEIKYEQ